MKMLGVKVNEILESSVAQRGGLFSSSFLVGHQDRVSFPLNPFRSSPSLGEKLNKSEGWFYLGSWFPAYLYPCIS